MTSTWTVVKGTLCGLALASACAVAGAQMQNGEAQQTHQQPGATQQGTTQPGSMNSPESQDAMAGGMQQGTPNMQDKQFLREAAQGGLFEIQAGQLASQKGQSEDVKQFGAMMVRDHTQLNDSLKPFFQQANEKVPTKPDGKDRKELAKLKGLSGSAFDKEYVSVMTKDHEHDLNAFKEEESNAQMPGLKAAVTQGEQVIQTHLDKIKQIASSMGSNSSSSGL